MRLLVVLLLSGCAGAPAWFRGARTMQEDFVQPEPILTVRWRRQLTPEPMLEYKPQEFASATSDGRRVFVGSNSSVLNAFDAQSGDLLWRKSLGGKVASQPRVLRSPALVVVGAQDGGLYALDPETGAQKWKYRAKGPIDSQPISGGGMIFFTSGENRVYAVNEKGEWKWQYERELPDGFMIRGYGAPLYHNGRIYAGFADGYLACLQAETGEVVWTRSLGPEGRRFSDVDATPIVADGTLYVSSYAGGVYALDPKDGSIKWRYEVEGAGSVVSRAGRVYFSAIRHGLHCLDGDGRLVFRQSIAKRGELSQPLIVGPFVLVASAEGGTYVADAENGRLHQYILQSHGVTSAPTADRRSVYVVSNGGYFYAYNVN